MAQIAFWNFDEAFGASNVDDSISADGANSNGSYVGGAANDGNGAAQFDGSSGHVVVPDDGSFNLEQGSIVIDFNQASASDGDVPWSNNAAQTLFSRDSSGFDGGGHLSIYIKSDGTVGIRHQTEGDSVFMEGGDVQLGEDTTIIYTWGPEGGQLVVDGVVVDTTTEALTLVGDSQPVVIGASQAVSGDGTANNLVGFFDGEISGVAIYDEAVDPGTVACFVAGTLIETANGLRLVEDLQVGDMVRTLDHGMQPLAWVDATHIPGIGQMAPVRIAANALGNDRAMQVSPHHRFLIKGWRAEVLFGESEVLVAAIDLVNDSTIRQVSTAGEVGYYHLGFENHEIIFAEGTPTESFAPTAEGMATLPDAVRAEILELFPHYAGNTETSAVVARPCLSSTEAQGLFVS